MKELILVTQPPHVPTLRGHMSAPATLVTMEMEQNVKVRSVPYFCNLRPAGGDPEIDRQQKYFFDSLCFFE